MKFERLFKKPDSFIAQVARYFFGDLSKEVVVKASDFWEALAYSPIDTRYSVSSRIKHRLGLWTFRSNKDRRKKFYVFTPIVFKREGPILPWDIIHRFEKQLDAEFDTAYSPLYSDDD